MNSKKATRQFLALKKIVEGNVESPRLAAEGWGKDYECLIAVMLSA